MNQNPSLWFLLYAALVPVMIVAAILIAWLDKRFGSKRGYPLRSAVVRLKYASLIAAIVMYLLLIRLPLGVHVGSGNPAEELERQLDKMLQAISIGLVVSSFWFAAAFGAIKELSASSAFKKT